MDTPEDRLAALGAPRTASSRREPPQPSAASRWRRDVKSREEQLTCAKQRALICVDTGAFACAVAGLRVDLAEHPLTKGVISSEQACADTKRR
jgi:hypothetical protein